ncbi:NAD(P)/FAD-dependent oxidoreductase [Flavobacterium sp. MC2016-06]|uniref:NAD(P)/FAD-dependent oxidoreductase n=1 Tax=Flavobacterium sp. MC2016-06 TaxID=2676308 RepID=UPI0012BB0B4C|nr:NAD(P)/FAD-dependent oxidoreductase [Flavobacterium sp. MC2016-06]MBU3860657.1 NAD(P)/FAD-dependent oxidoreductase [Flavobacterium sp. MC2016-06]
MNSKQDVIIIGGGLAGLASAIHLCKLGLKVTLIEKSAYPHHKVCGEYISNEILPYLKYLDAYPSNLEPANINQFQFTSENGTSTTTKLPLGGFGISRYKLDHFLYEKALNSGCNVLQETVNEFFFNTDTFTIKTSNQTMTSRIVLGAYGKRSNIDSFLSREFFNKKSPWLAVKAHYSGNFPDDLVALHNFKGGYCGVSKVENNIINICYLADYSTFKKYKNINDYQRNVLYKNKNLKAVFENASLLFEKPITISQISFDKKKPVENHILMIGDSAGLIHPLCGNGMAMAIHSAKIASELVFEFYSGKIKSRAILEQKYTKEWKNIFGKRLFTGRVLATVLQNKRISNVLIAIAALFPSLLQFIIKQTHGKTIAID